MAAIVSRACFNFGTKTLKYNTFVLSSANCVGPKYILDYKLYSKDLPELNEAELYEINEDEDAEEKEQEIQMKRNKSRLNQKHYNILNDRVPYDEPQAWFHHSVKYKKRLFGRYGMKSDIPLGILWPTKSELENSKEYEQVKYPESLQTIMTKLAEKKKTEELESKKHQEDLVAKFAKLDQWKKELNAKIEKKMKEAEASRLKKERLMEEVRRHFGYNVNIKDDKFKEMLEQKEREEKKMEKDAKKKAKQDKMMQQLLLKSAEAGESKRTTEKATSTETKKSEK